MELVARQEQLSQLEELLQRALRGQMQIALVTGESGIGKTFLLDEFFARVTSLHPELFACKSKCFEAVGSVQDPYTPVVQFLDEIVAAKRDSITWDRLRLSLVELAPDWLQPLPGGNLGVALVRAAAPEHDAAGDKSQTNDLQRRMVQFVNAMRLTSHNAPMILAIDDLQWCDKPTLQLLTFLADQLPISPILLVLMYRPSAVAHRQHGEMHPVRQTVTQLKRFGRCVEIPLPNFQKEEIHQFLVHQNYAFPEPVIEQLAQRSEGNPLFLREYLSLLHARNQIVRDQDHFQLAPEAQGSEIPDNVEMLIQERLDLIAGDLQRLLSHTSARTDRFATQVLTGTLKKIPESRIYKYLNQLEDDYRLISELEDQRLVVKVGPEYRFVHALLQQVLYQDLSDSQRKLLHQVIARMLESLYGDDLTPNALYLARHYELGGSLPRAINYYFMACQHAIAGQSLNEALELAQKVQDLVRHLQPSEHRAAQWMSQAMLQEAEIHFCRGDYRACLTAAYEGDKLCQQHDLNELRANFCYWQSRALRTLGQAGESVEMARRALTILDQGGNPRLRGLLHAYLGSVSDSLPVDELNQHLNEALQIAERNHLPDVKVKALLEMAGMAVYRTDRPADTLNYARQAAKLAAANGMYNDQVTACRQEAFACLRLGRFDDALSLDQQAVDLARHHGLPVALHLALFSLALSWSTGMDNPNKGLELLHESLEIAEQNGFKPSRNVHGALFNITFALGRWDEAREARENFYTAIATSYPRALGLYLRMKGHELFAQGQYENAVEAYRSAIEMYHKHSPDGRDARTVEPYLGMALVEAGEDLAARPLLEDTCDFWKGRQPSRHARSLCALATLFLKRGESSQAIPLLRQALIAVERSPSDQPWPVRPQVSMMLGRALMMNGEYEEALVHAQWAHEHYRRMNHFLTGDAAYWLGQIFIHLRKPDLAGPYLNEARQRWVDLGLKHRMPWLEEFTPSSKGGMD